MLEAHRIAEYVIAPWEVDPAPHAFGGLIDTALSGAVATAQMIADNGVLEPRLPRSRARTDSSRVSPLRASQRRQDRSRAG